MKENKNQRSTELKQKLEKNQLNKNDLKKQELILRIVRKGMTL